MIYIVGRISDHAIVEISVRTGVDASQLLVSIAANKGGDPADYSLFSIEENTATAQRIKEGDAWVAVWTDASITGVDFTAYDVLDKIRFNSDKNEILANGIESCKITVKLINAADTDIAPDVAGVYIPVQTPTGLCQKKVDIVAGIVRFDFSTFTPGEWKFPANGVRKILGYKVKNQQIINALLS